MTITYTWNFNPLETKPTEGDLSDVVTTIHWQLHGTDDETNASSSNIGTVSVSAADADNFTAFANLTEATVKGWVLAGLAQDEETAEEAEVRLQQNISNAIDKINNPPIVKRTAPWVS